MLVLLKTKMVDHKKLTEELHFGMLIQSSAVRLSGGIVLMWKEYCVTFNEVSITPQGIHAMVKASRWIVHKGNRMSFINYAWIPNQPVIRDMIEGPLTPNDMTTKVDTNYNAGN
ncbi:hypothetical protein A4A49_60831 [Nicotiana attenuata]|uniref:Uncharacterized protein n=1 Tax=Nicotiana attenuata TaxID=49451 RepID=A0A1J6IV09_NICAT|nr:hypothetical protein A4A49_60831 [Nicotiana attenuata]